MALLKCLSLLLSLLFKWPILFPLLALCSYWASKNKKSTGSETFFADFQFGGHRGSNTKEPENTIASMDRAYAEGAQVVEFDISLTKDGIAVLLHDDTLDRTTNKTGLVRDVLFKDLSDCDTGPKFFAKYNVERSSDESSSRPVPTLEEMVIWAKMNRMKMFFDVKDPDEVMRTTIQRLFKVYDLYKVGLVCSFYPTIVYRIKRDNPDILTAITWRRWAFSYKDPQNTMPRYSSFLAQKLAELVDTLNVGCIRTWLPSFLAVDMVLTERAEISERFVRKQEAAGRRVCAWTVNDQDEMKWMRNTLKIPFLTDRPFLAKEVLK